MDKHNLTYQKTVEESPNTITDIRMLENVANKTGEYLVQYGSGGMKIFKTMELMIANPIKFAEYLERKHKV